MLEGKQTISASSDDLKGSSIEVIAKMIQERADVLADELNALKTLEDTLSQQKKDLHKQVCIYDVNRKKLLVQKRMAHRYELEVIKYKRMIQDLNSQIDSNRKERKKIENEMDSIRKECESIDYNLYVPHQYKTSMYKQGLENKVQGLKASRQRREETLDHIKSETERNRQETILMEREASSVKAEIKMLEEVERRENEEIAANAMQIRATLAKRASLKSALYEAQDRNREANDDMVKWEEECMKLSNHNRATLAKIS